MEVVAGVREMIEVAGASRREAAARFGLREEQVAIWARQYGWRRAGARGVPRREVVRNSIVDRGGRPTPRPHRYGPEVREAARALIEETRIPAERIAISLGIAPGTLQGWRKRGRWQRPEPPGRAVPAWYRSPRRRGRPYGGDAVGRVRELATHSTLSLKRIAERTGVSECTVRRWIVRGGWTRPPGARDRRRKEPYGSAVVAAAGELFRTSRMSTARIAARVGATPERVAHWARTGGWTRPE